MKTRALFAALSAVLWACLLPAPPSTAADLPIRTAEPGVVHGGVPGLAKAAGDTVDLMGPTGSGAPYLGDFEAGWSGWTSVDLTRQAESHWQVTDYNQAVAGNLLAWCGDLTIPSCNDSLDPVGGYGNSWEDLLAWRVTVVDPGIGGTINVTATLQYDTEQGYDFVHLCTRTNGSFGYNDLQVWDGNGTASVDNGTAFQSAELLDGTDAYIAFRFTSDGAWSDEDCQYRTAGACGFDEVTVTVSQAGQPDIVSFTDFQDGTFGDWAPDFAPGVGDFAHIWEGLADVDPCGANFSHQVAFIDDGVVVPGTGGSDCINWCYGPGGFIVTTTGGLGGPGEHIQNYVYSPVMDWPGDQYEGLTLAFDVFRHEDLSADAPGIFYLWDIRSADTDGSAGHGVQTLEEAGFRDRSFVYYGGPDYLRPVYELSDLLSPGRDVVQVRFGVYQLGWVWGWRGHDGYPAPYFDNVSVKVYPFAGPALVSREIDLAQDDFPAVDAINLGNLGSLGVRFDMARNISLAAHLRNDPGDSIVVDVAAVRNGATLVGVPRMHYLIRANPVFDPYRTTSISGAVDGQPAVGASGIPQPGRWAFDLPDTGTLFPGDVLHYYIRATDDAAGDVRTATLPADLAGFGDFQGLLSYPEVFTVRALPTISEDFLGGLYTPRILFWNDFSDRGGLDEWMRAIGLVIGEPGVDLDIFTTNGPTSGVGNGIGGRTSGLALEYYDMLYYTAGSLDVNTISNGDFDDDAGDDLSALLQWMSTGNKSLFLSGDGLAGDLAFNAGASGTAFVEDVLGVNVVSSDLRPGIGNQSAPLVLVEPGNLVFQNIGAWRAYGGCPTLSRFDAVTARAGAQRLAEFGDPNGNPGAYSFAAATLNVTANFCRVVSLPYDLMSVYTEPGAKVTAPLASREQLLLDVTDFFGHVSSGEYVAVPSVDRFAVSAAPNPFNPAVKISYTIGGPGRLVLKVYDLRGRLVRTLHDGPVAGDGFVMWDGHDERGGQAASGIYFTEARLGDQVQVGKIALIK